MCNVRRVSCRAGRASATPSRRTVCFAFVILAVSAVMSFGQAHPKETFQPTLRPAIAHINWTQRDGAPAHIAALAQTKDGYLWAGSPLGLYRFDGVQFSSYPLTSLDERLPYSDVESLASDDQGGLWIGFRLGGISYLGSNGAVTDYNRNNRKGPGEVQQLLVRNDGSVWAIGDGKLITLKNGEWQNFGLAHGLAQDELYTFYFDRLGNLWTSARGRVFVLKKTATKFELYSMESFAIVQFAETAAGQLWVSDAWHGVHPVQEKTLQPASTTGFITRGLARIVIEPSGTIWMAQDYRGVSHFDALHPEDVVKEPTASEQTEAILRDQAGNIWVGSSLGLDQFRPSALQSLGGFRMEYYPSLAADPDAGVLVATHEHPILHVTGSTLLPFGQRVGSSPIVAGGAGRVWLVDPKLHNLVLYEDGKIISTPEPPETNLTVAQSIGLDLDGWPLVSFLTKGLWRYDGVWHRMNDGALADDDALAIFRSSSDQVWFGFADSRILMRDASGFHAVPLTQSDGIGNVLVFARVQGRIWAGGTDGVAFLDAGAFRKIQLSDGIALRGVSGIVEDKSHSLWFNARAGLVRIRSEAVQKFVEDSSKQLPFDLLDERLGLAGSATQLKPTPSAVAEADGTLVFATDGNVFFLDPHKISFRSPAPKVMLQSVLVNERPVLDREHTTSQIHIGAGSMNALEIDYIGIDLVSPEKVNYKYMLEGEDNGWQDAGNRRVAFYRHLRPGKYWFRMSAANGDEAPATFLAPLLVTVTPAFYQTTWFHLLCSLLTLSLLYFAYLVRLQYVTNRLKDRMQQRSSERIRIAQELHDTLLQSIYGLMLRFHFATEELPADEPARKALQLALSRADEVMVEGRERVQSLREDLPEAADFAAELSIMASKLEIQKSVAFHVTENGDPRDLKIEVRSELGRIAREALTNILRHAGALSAEISLDYGDREFMMKCYDDGVGIEPSIVSNGKRDGHWGLVGIRERASAVGGTLALWSSPGRGTEIEIRIPGTRAYVHRRKPPKLWQRLSRLRHEAHGTERSMNE